MDKLPYAWTSSQFKMWLENTNRRRLRAKLTAVIVWALKINCLQEVIKSRAARSWCSCLWKDVDTALTGFGSSAVSRGGFGNVHSSGTTSIPSPILAPIPFPIPPPIPPPIHPPIHPPSTAQPSAKCPQQGWWIRNVLEVMRDSYCINKEEILAWIRGADRAARARTLPSYL